MTNEAGSEAHAAPGPVAFSPVAIVHGLPHVKAAIAAARLVGFAELTLVTARGAPDAAGALWCAELDKLARDAAGDLALTFVTDCADAPGRALEAMACGARCVALTERPEVFARVLSIAEQIGATVLPQAPAGLDLAFAAEPKQACLAAWGPR
jgi:hypothetical protein